MENDEQQLSVQNLARLAQLTSAQALKFSLNAERFARVFKDGFHDLRGILTAIYGNCDLLKMIPDLSEDNKARIEAIRELGERIQEIVEAMDPPEVGPSCIHLREIPTPLKSDEAEKQTQEKTALVIDDDETVRNFLVRLLKNLGYGTFEASSAKKGIELLKENPEISLVTLDINMPDMSGVEAYPILKQQKPNVKVIVITGNMDEYSEEKFPGAQVLRKPFDIKDFEALIG
jgi:CheY-like chemotaxis protein